MVKYTSQLPENVIRREHTMQGGLLRAKYWCPEINTVVDVGAAAGSWTRQAIMQWPDAKYLLIEPLAERKETLEALAAQYHNVEVIQAVLGDRKDEITFSVSDDLDGSGVYGQEATNASRRKINMISLDELVEEKDTTAPYLLKLDTHGFEMPIFEGASQALEQTKLIIVESYGFFVSPHAKLFYEICVYLDERGFRPIDIVDVVNRKKDGAFWQCDVFFAPKSLAVFNDNTYA